MKKCIVKVQLPIASNEADAPMLIYSEDQSIFTTMPIDAKSKKHFTDLKSFHYARLRDDGILEFLGQAPWQNW